MHFRMVRLGLGVQFRFPIKTIRIESERKKNLNSGCRNFAINAIWCVVLRNVWTRVCVCLCLDIIRGDKILIMMMTTTKTYKSNPIFECNYFRSSWMLRSSKLVIKFYAHTERISARREKKWPSISERCHKCKCISMTVKLYEFRDIHACIYPSIICNQHANFHHARTHTHTHT